MGCGEGLIVNPEAAQDRLLELRMQIDTIDNRLLDLFVERFNVTRQVGEMKRDAGLPPADKSREASMLLRLRGDAESRGLNPDTIEDIYKALLAHVVQEHTDLR